MRGDAEAYSIEAKAKAEAEQMAKKADAWKDYQDAAMVDMILETLPKVYIYFHYECIKILNIIGMIFLLSVLGLWKNVNSR